MLGVRLMDGYGEPIDSHFILPEFDVKLLASLPTIMLAYAFQTAFFPVYESLKYKSYANGIKMSLMAMFFVFAIYIGISLVALYQFKVLETDILVNLANKKDGYSIVL
jgi:amino acid permease